MLIRLVVPGQPVSAKNSKRAFQSKSGRPVVVTSKAAKAWYADAVPALARQFAALGMPTIKGAVHVETHQFVRHDITSKANPDGDNVQAAAWDALTRAFVLADDRLVLSWAGTRQQDRANPRVEIEIRVLAA